MSFVFGDDKVNLGCMNKKKEQVCTRNASGIFKISFELGKRGERNEIFKNSFSNFTFC